jgi:hypothetical protein
MDVGPYFIGIGGIGMSGIAVSWHFGYKVQGSDLADNLMSLASQHGRVSIAIRRPILARRRWWFRPPSDSNPNWPKRPVSADRQARKCW